MLVSSAGSPGWATQQQMPLQSLADHVALAWGDAPAMREAGAVLADDAAAAFRATAGAPGPQAEIRRLFGLSADDSVPVAAVVVKPPALCVALGYLVAVANMSLAEALSHVANILATPVFTSGAAEPCLAAVLTTECLAALLHLEHTLRHMVSDLSSLAGGCPREWMYVRWIKPCGTGLYVAGRGRLMDITRLRAHPRMAYIRGMVSDEEAQHIMKIVDDGDLLKPSQVVSFDPTAAGGKTLSADRTSKSCKISVSQDVAVQRVMQRAAYLTGLTPQHAEAAQVVHYDSGQEFRLHHDYIDPSVSTHITAERGNRLVSFFVYLNECEGEGRTCFPKLDMAFEPEKGCAVCWYNIDRDGRLDVDTLHAGEPVKHGEKYGMNIWLRQRQRRGGTGAAEEPGVSTCARCGDRAGPMGLCLCTSGYRDASSAPSLK